MKTNLDPLWQVYEVDAWAEGESGWTYNDMFRIGASFRTAAEDMRRVFLRKLKELRKIPLNRGVFRVVWDDFNILEVQRRSDGCPVYCMMRMSHER